MNIYSIFSYAVLTVLLHQNIINNEENKSQSSSLQYVVLDTQSKHTVDPKHFSNANTYLYFSHQA